MNLQHRDFRLEIKDVTDAGQIEGYASVFGGAPDAYGDIIAAGAFGPSLAEHRRNGTSPIMLYGHDASQPPIGNWVELAEDGKGLWVKGEIDLEDSLGLRVYRALKRKAMKGLSIGYETKESERDPKRPGVRILKEIDLWEVSPVPFPAQTRAAVDTVKSILQGGELPSVRDFEESLRESGFPNSLAVAIAAKAAPLLRRESDADNQSALSFLTAMKG